MKLADIGEFGLIHRIAPQFLPDVPQHSLGIGDDCAVLPHNDHESLLVTTDMLIQDIHFLREKTRARDLGYKSLAVNLSDIAAMGGIPTAAFLSLAVPTDISVDWLDDFFAGINDLAHKSATPLLGGDTTKSKSGVIINIVVVGRVHPEKIKYRTTAQVGDVVCLTSEIGDSGGGLQIILHNLEDTNDSNIQQLLTAHHKPEPHLPQGVWLASQESVHAMLDVSDGIDSDIKRIMEASQVGARVDIASLPISASLTKIANRFDWNAAEIAATGGEDYCLLCTIHPDHYESVAAAFAKEFDNPLYQIGAIQAGHQLEYFDQNQKIDFAKHGWDHFK